MMIPLLLAVLVIPLPAGFHAQSIVTADFNGDGHADVAICGEHLIVFGGDGNGRFRPFATNGHCGPNPAAMAAADVNGDGRVDIVVANHDTDFLTLLRNEGGGRFASETIHVHSKPHPHTVAAADLNHDGRVDLITDSWGENRLTLLLAGRAGQWQTPGTPIDVGRKPYINVVSADFDGDGNIDLVVPNQGFDTVTVLFGDGRGNFQRSEPIVAGATPFMVAVADVNGDGRPDIVVANYSGHIGDIANDGLTWLRNDGQRRFTAFRSRIPGRGCWRVAAGDLNGDGIDDAAFVNGADDTVTIAYGSKNGLRPGPSIRVMPHPHNLAIAEGRLFVITEERDEIVEVELLARPAGQRRVGVRLHD